MKITRRPTRLRDIGNLSIVAILTRRNSAASTRERYVAFSPIQALLLMRLKRPLLVGNERHKGPLGPCETKNFRVYAGLRTDTVSTFRAIWSSHSGLRAALTTTGELDRGLVNRLLRQLLRGVVVDPASGRLLLQWLHGGETTVQYGWPKEPREGAGKAEQPDTADAAS